MSIQKYSSCRLPTLYGIFDLIIYRNERDEELIVMISEGLDLLQKTPFVRIHSQCFTGEVLGSMKCDCREQLVFALEHMGRKEGGILIYLQQEGRGIGLGNKVKAYSLQEKGADTLEANHMLGFAGDLRDFDMAAEVLLDLGIHRIRLNTNNPEKIDAILSRGIEIEEILPSIGNENPYNKDYLKTKAEKMGHIQLMGIPMHPLDSSSENFT